MVEGFQKEDSEEKEESYILKEKREFEIDNEEGRKAYMSDIKSSRRNGKMAGEKGASG